MDKRDDTLYHGAKITCDCITESRIEYAAEVERQRPSFFTFAGFVSHSTIGTLRTTYIYCQNNLSTRKVYDKPIHHTTLSIKPTISNFKHNTASRLKALTVHWNIAAIEITI